MINSSFPSDFSTIFAQLNNTEQQQVLAYMQSLQQKKPRTIQYADLQKLIGQISTRDLQLMSKAIQEDCRQVDHDSW